MVKKEPIYEYFKNIDDATDLLYNTLDMNNITTPVAACAALRIYTSCMIASGFSYEKFVEALEEIKKDYKKHCEARCKE